MSNAVVYIFQVAAAGYGGKKIARILNEQHEAKRTNWRPSTVLSILANQAYCGHRIWNKKCETKKMKNPQQEWIITRNSHPAIINEQLWSAAQAALMVRKMNK